MNIHSSDIWCFDLDSVWETVQTEAAEAGGWMCVPCVLLWDLSSYEPVLSESHSSPLCPLLVLSLKAARGPAGRNTALGVVCLEGSMAKIGRDEARSLPGAPRVELHNRGCWSDSRRRRWWESVQLIPSGGCVTSRIWLLNWDLKRLIFCRPSSHDRHAKPPEEPDV